MALSTPRLLIIAGSDSGGGAGIQGDIKTASALGVFATTAITALTAQNTQGVFGIHEVPTPFLRQQIELVLADIGTDAIKTGMLHSAEVIEAVVASISGSKAPLVVDPVMIAKGGAPLLQAAAVEALKNRLIPLATVVTPNVPEAEALSGIRIHNTEDMEKAGRAILAMGCKAVLVKGGHLPGAEITDVLIQENSIKIYKNQRINTENTHGTGCTLASAIACGLAQHKPLETAVAEAQNYVQGAIKNAPKLGTGHGPLNHGWMQAEKSLV